MYFVHHPATDCVLKKTRSSVNQLDRFLKCCLSEQLFPPALPKSPYDQSASGSKLHPNEMLYG